MTKSAMSDPITLRIPLDVLTDIETIAEMTERSRSWVIVRALRTYLLNEGADILAFRNGQQEIANGDSDSEDFDQVITEMNRIVAEKVA